MVAEHAVKRVLLSSCEENAAEQGAGRLPSARARSSREARGGRCHRADESVQRPAGADEIFLTSISICWTFFISSFSVEILVGFLHVKYQSDFLVTCV